MRGGPLQLFPILTVAALAGPVIAGLVGALLPAMGHLPAAGLNGPSWQAWQALLSWPGLAATIRLSVVTGLVATACALAIVALVLAGWSGTRTFARLQRALSPMLAVPHAAAAFALAFLVAPSGWIARLLSPWATGWERPPDLLLLNDPGGGALIAGLVVKEVPFLLLMSLAALPQTRPEARLRIALALGYGRVGGWLKTVFPAVYVQIRLPVYVVLAYGMSTVDMALILGPATPPPLSVQIVTWMATPELADRATAAAAALLQALLVLSAIGFWRAAEMVVARLGRLWVRSGRRGTAPGSLRALGLVMGSLSAVAILGGLISLTIWSVAGFWGFPDSLPQSFDGARWRDAAPALARATLTTAVIAAVSVTIALVLALACLEAGSRAGIKPGARLLWLIYLPLLVPQTAFLPGLQTLLLATGLATGFLPVIFAHLAFVLPYVFLSLSDPWRAWDSRLGAVAAGLGASPSRVFWQIRLPMLLRAVLTAVAVGFAVSVGQYLPTLLIGGGRVATLTTEAVALSAGGDRRAIGIWSIAQTAAAIAPFALALAVPAVIWRNRRGLHA